ncbi:hypothetical protein GIB67_012623 [Kingdonia uniflora]|uniref:RNA-dependent RNA polymerase n=1 Tax=Kingdonia uniflora TaxID=39325 RepID=A0A7J7NEW0_9MAGN|nr:hypothetical protein GIB67_012623 [Kingdonia uniflora]
MEGKIHVSECYYLMGTADPTGLLNSDEVCIIMDKGKIVGEVLVYRIIGLHFGDIHVLQATYVKELENIVCNAKYAIFFPTKGPRSLAAEIENVDFESNIIGTASDRCLAFMDRLLILGDNCEEEKNCIKEKMLPLTDIYYDALDAPKSEKKVIIPKDLMAEKFPHFMKKWNSYNSKSVLGQIHDKVESFQSLEMQSKEV